MEPIINFFSGYIDIKLSLLIIVSSLWAKKYIAPVATQLPILKRLSIAHIIFVWSLLLMVAYYIVLKNVGQFVKEDWSKYAVTYFFTTSFYELAFAPLQTLAQKIFNNDKLTKQ